MATFKYVYRPSSRGDDFLGGLSLRVIHNRKPMTLSVSCRLFHGEWDEERQEIVSAGAGEEREQQLREARERLAACTEKVRGVIRRLERKGAYSSRDVIRLFKRTTDETMLSGFAAALAEDLRENNQQRTARAYGTVTRRLKGFLGGRDIPPEDLTGALVKRFEAYLKAEGLKPNSINFYLSNLRAIYNKAVACGRVPRDRENPFAEVSTGTAETKKRGLTAECVQKLKDLRVMEKAEEQGAGARARAYARTLHGARQFFLFCLYAHGMCFVDMVHLRKSDIRDGEIRYNRKKTGGQIVVPVNRMMQEIIDEFAAETKDSPYLFPMNRDRGPEWYNSALHGYNRHLKELARRAELDVRLTAHMARHSWASICKSKMISTAIICEGLGHSSEKMTRKYLTCFDSSVMRKAGMTVVNAICQTAPHRRPAPPA